MKNLLLIIAFAAFFADPAQAQNAKEFEKWGDMAAEINDHYGAALYYRKAMDIDSSQSKLIWKYAEALRGYNDYKKAAYYYHQIYRKDRGRLYPEGPFHLATMLKNTGDYRESKKLWKQVSNSHRQDRNSYYYLKAQQEMIACDSAMIFENQRAEVDLEHLTEPINSYDAEYSAIIDEDGGLYFGSLKGELGKDNQVIGKKYEINLYYSPAADDTWTDVTPLDTTVNRPGFHTANPAFSPSGEHLVYTQCTDSMICVLMAVSAENGVWQNPRQLNGEINIPGCRNTQPSFTTFDGREYLFFTSDRSGGYGKYDLYYAEHFGDLSFGPVHNLGPAINSTDNEISPWYDGENRTLYFSSDWHPGLGGFDIFSSDGFGNQWETPRNIRPPFNSPANDLYYRYHPAHKTGLLVSNREGSLVAKGETCCNDIYRFNYPDSDTLPEIETLEQLSDYLPVTLYFHNDIPDPRSWDTTTTKNYMDTYNAYRAMLSEYQEEYGKGLKKSEKEIAAATMADFFENKVDLGVEHLELFTKLLLRELEKGQRIELTIKGYASPLARSDYNVNLTQRRIQSLINYLRSYNMGVFVPYIEETAVNGGKLAFVRVPFGAYRAEKSVSDNLHDQRNSVYSRSAALERKIEIQSIARVAADSSEAEIVFSELVHNFGEVNATDTLKHSFHFSNRGAKPLQIYDVVNECGCATIKYPLAPIAPGDSLYLEVFFEGFSGNGKESWSFKVLTNGVPEETELVVTAEVKE